MNVVSELLGAVGTLAAVVLILLMAVVPFLVDLPPRDSVLPRRKGRSAARPTRTVGPRA